MDVALLVSGSVLAIVFTIAGGAKLLDLAGSRRAVAAFGVPVRLAGPIGTVLPAAELTTAALLAAGIFSAGAARIGGVSATVLLAVFSAAIATSIARGRTPDCHCFGKLHSAPAGPGTLVRNAALLGLAAFVGTGEPLAAAPAVLLLAFVRPTSPTAEGLPPGAPAPDFDELGSLRARGLPLLLLFSDTDCGPCQAMAPDVIRWQREHADVLTIAVLERRPEIAVDYGVQGTPMGVLVGADFDVCCEGRCGEFGRTRCDCDGVECTGDEICSTGEDGTQSDCISCSVIGWKRCGADCADPTLYRCCGDRLYEKAKLGPGEWTCCGPAGNRRLINTSESESNCGGCGRRCASGKFCFKGRCRDKCPQGSKRCGKTCGDPRTHSCCGGKLRSKSDPGNCGDCGVECGTYDCCNGNCCDYNADTCCGDGCKNLALDDDNCGACGNACGPNEYCRFGVCTCPLGDEC
jgi:thiol-disulfide isomerase/thioredoxin